MKITDVEIEAITDDFRLELKPLPQNRHLSWWEK